ncbi:hypothetical protein KK083_03945 [Fulvivirgaceae bacterium PWU4]|uniref:Uncharacterized protein n=1 Tax=Chryseosolibacter histidini TaxID=2782349 RepID=A0AAP2DGW4_9BACT|nr:hypothetical protein [Chryseosolibacter histidini]MBT1696015.1 hypothetical protein [Chryseosolibacter histidini]
MTKQLVKPILAGILIGVAFYVLPFFFFRGFFFFIVVFFLIRFLFWGRWGGPFRGWRGYYGHNSIHPAFADTIRKMSDEEYETFKKKFDGYRMSADDEGRNQDSKR